MIRILEDHLKTLSGMKLIEFGTGYLEPIHFDIAKNNDLTVSDIEDIPNHCLGTESLKIMRLDACDTGLAENSFDAAYSSMLIPHIDANRHFKEAKRILKDNGVYWFACTGTYHNIEIKEPALQRLNINADQMEQTGALLIQEELYHEYYNKTNELKRYLRKIGADDELSNYDSDLKLTKHYLLFELRK